MKPTHSSSMPRRESGQTIVIALLVLGVLLILGFVFIGIIDQNNKVSYKQGNRSVAMDLALGGIHYAHQQMLQSELGADWKGAPTPPVTPAPGSNVSFDPDLYYLRPAAQLANGTPLPIMPGSSQIDLGGPDGLGPYFRVNNANGRSLVRVRYAPSDANIFSTSPVGPLRHPGLARDYIIIESVGREGVFNVNDPTQINGTTAIQFQNFNTEQDFQAAFATMKQGENRYPYSQVIRAFASIGIIESARFITNKYNVNRSADIGVPPEMGAQYPTNAGDLPVAPQLTYLLGGSQSLYNLGIPPTPAIGNFVGGGSLYSNASVLLHGNVTLDLNRYMGDQFDVAGAINGDGSGVLNLNVEDVTGNAWAPPVTTTLTAGGAPSFNSLSPSYSTVSGLLRDASSATDPITGGPRSIGYKTPPSMEVTDPDTGENRYVGMTQDSGVQGSGKYGFGAGVYVNNPSDIQEPTDENGRANAGAEQSLEYDWMNVGNGQPGSGWQGYLYVPPAAYVQLLDDGFAIQLNTAGPAAERTWKYVDGSDTGGSFIRYRIGVGTQLGPNGLPQLHIVNSNTPATAPNPVTGVAPPQPTIDINSNLSPADFQKGPVYNGVLYFAGNVRIRGIIPTDVQLTLVSNSTIYIEGSITKGITANGLPNQGVPVGNLITRPSKSTLMLMAGQYVALNTSQFFGVAPTQAIEAVQDTPNLVGFNPIRVRSGGAIPFNWEFARDPSPAQPTTTVTSNPATYLPYAMNYFEYGAPGNKIPTSLLISHTMDDGAASATFFRTDVNLNGGGNSPYFFSSVGNTASNYIVGVTPTSLLPVYGLGSETYQRYPAFESKAFTLVDPNTSFMSANNQLITAGGTTGKYTLYAEGTNQLTLSQMSIAGVSTNDYLIGRSALEPHDVRIEAAIYAEEGSFFVIPGPWFNPNPQDRRDIYLSGTDIYSNDTTVAEKNATRLENFGSYPGMPFYGEPLDVRVVISGAVSENMPPPAAVQAQWLQKWGWIPRDLAATGSLIPNSHVPTGININPNNPGSSFVVPNLIINYDPVLATDRSNGFVIDNSSTTLIRTDAYGRPEPPMPRLPVSPTLAYFGEVQ